MTYTDVDGNGSGANLYSQRDKLQEMATVATPRAISVAESLARHEAVENALADLRLEGLAPSTEAEAFFHSYIQGDLTEEELVTAILAR